MITDIVFTDKVVSFLHYTTITYFKFPNFKPLTANVWINRLIQISWCKIVFTVESWNIVFILQNIHCAMNAHAFTKFLRIIASRVPINTNKFSEWLDLLE